jgi:autotransporter-associated beta strand protein
VTEGGALHIASGNAGMGLVNHSTNTLTVNSEIYESFPGTGLAKSGPGPVTINGKVGVVGDMLVKDGCLTLEALANEKHLIGSYFEMRGGAQTPTELKLHGSAEVANNGNLYAGINPGDRCVVTITNDLTIQALTKEEGGRFYVGSGVNTAGAVIQNSGDVIVSINLSGTAFYILGGYGGYGYHRLNNGSLATGEMTIGASSSSGDGNSSVVDIFGGELKIEGWCILVSWGKGAGALNVFNGAVNCPGTLGSEAFLLTYNNGVGSTAQVNLLGPNARVFADGPYEKKRINMARGANNALSALNLNDGELALHQAFVTSDTTPSHFNFNGGLLKAANSSMMMSGLTAAHVFNGNARIDTDGYNAAINQPLVAPHGYGAVSIELLSGGSGYIGAPAVVLQGGSGIGATAIALVDLESDSITCGQVTNIMVTGSGVGYAETDTLNAVLRGGGCLTPATAGAVSLAPNVSGALIKLGAGTLTLNGACTYTGGTLVSEGTLKLGCADALPPSGTVTLAEGTILDLNGFTATNAVAGAGTFINGALYGEFSPAGTGVIGAQTLTPGANAALAGAYILDVEESGACDQLVISGDINLSALQLQVVDPAKLNRRKSYPIAAVSGQVTGVFAPGNLPNEKWLIKNAKGTLWLLYSDGLQLIIR